MAYGYSITSDGAGDAIVTGFIKGTVVFGIDTLRSSTWGEVFVAKYDSSGNFLWAKQSNELGSNAVVVANAIGTDLNGNIYITGWFQETAIFDRDTLSTLSPNDMFLVKYNSNGIVLWAKKFDYSSGGGSSVALDKEGQIYITGNFGGEIIYGNDTLSAAKGGFFVAKYDTLGSIIWARNDNSASRKSSASGASIALDGEDYIYVAGNFIDTVSFGLDTLRCLVPNNDNDAFIVKYDSNGNEKWAEQAYTLGTNYWSGFSVACDTLKRGGGYLGFWCPKGGGNFDISIGGDTFNFNTPNIAELLIKFDSAGKTVCGSIFTEGVEDDGDGLNVDPSGEHVYFVGDMSTQAIFGSDTLKYNPNAELPFIACWRPCDAPTLSVNNVSVNKSSITIFPNPSTGQFTLSLSNVSEKCHVEVYNVLGEKVYSSGPPQTPKGALIAVNISDQPNGIYLYRVIAENGSLVGEGKIIVQK